MLFKVRRRIFSYLNRNFSLAIFLESYLCCIGAEYSKPLLNFFLSSAYNTIQFNFYGTVNEKIVGKRIGRFLFVNHHLFLCVWSTSFPSNKNLQVWVDQYWQSLLRYSRIQSLKSHIKGFRFPVLLSCRWARKIYGCLPRHERLSWKDGEQSQRFQQTSLAYVQRTHDPEPGFPRGSAFRSGSRNDLALHDSVFTTNHAF